MKNIKTIKYKGYKIVITKKEDVHSYSNSKYAYIIEIYKNKTRKYKDIADGLTFKDALYDAKIVINEKDRFF